MPCQNKAAFRRAFQQSLAGIRRKGTLPFRVEVSVSIFAESHDISLS